MFNIRNFEGNKNEFEFFQDMLYESILIPATMDSAFSP